MQFVLPCTFKSFPSLENCPFLSYIFFEKINRIIFLNHKKGQKVCIESATINQYCRLQSGLDLRAIIFNRNGFANITAHFQNNATLFSKLRSYETNVRIK